MGSAPAPMLVLLHSPLVGALTWRAAAAQLRAREWGVVVPSLAGVTDAGPPYYPRLATRVAAAVRAARPAGPLLLVGHSGAGPLLPAVAGAWGGAVAGAVFVDAGLPHPGVSWLDAAPPGLRAALLRRAAGGRLPPWHEWFPPGTLDGLLPELAPNQEPYQESPPRGSAGPTALPAARATGGRVTAGRRRGASRHVTYGRIGARVQAGGIAPRFGGHPI